MKLTTKKIVIAVTVLLLITAIISALVNPRKHGSKLAIITVFDGINEKTYLTDSIISQKEKCIVFIDVFGRTNSVCAENIVVTQ